MPSTINIPRSIAAAQAKLTELGEISTATEWHRAAIVAAYVQPATHGGRPDRASSDLNLLTAASFAALGIVGLSSTGTVLIYAKAWLDRFDRPKPGGKITLPDDPWPPTRPESLGSRVSTDPERAVAQVIEKHGLNAIITAVVEQAPEAVAKAVANDDEADVAVSQARLTRNINRPGAAEMRDRNDAREKRMDDAIADSTTQLERTGLAEHEGNIHLRQAAMHLAKAAAEFDRNPVLSDEQQGRCDEAMTHIEHYVRLLHGDGEWTGNDDDFLRSLGIEGVAS